jgi:Na+-translocating ferredoxin:NAD+ oxidoreductase RnfE subunit
MSRLREFTKGIIKENPTYVQVLGMCPTLAVTTSAINGLGMGLATTAVLTMSNVVISLIRKIVPGTIFGYKVWELKIFLEILPPGAYITLGLLSALFTYIGIRRKKRGEVK